MQAEPRSAALASRRGRWALALGGLVVVVAAVLLWWRGRPADSDAADPRLTFETPYQNVRPEVQYVGAEVCANCHGEIADHYGRHPMGQSLAPVDSATIVEHFGKNSFAAGNLEYVIEKKDAELIHHARLRDAKGAELLHVAEPMRFAIGSGSRGRSYLFQRGRQLFQSPISWYGRGRHWELSPGYAKKHLHFERRVLPLCLYCHANHAENVPSTMDSYHEPIFRGHAIGCERCHGPGELHVRRHEAGEAYQGADTTIVNPARLEPGLRDDVCAQCHLLGEQRVVRRGRQREEFRPGLPLPLFEAVFVRHPDFVDYAKSVGHFEQMAISRCAQESRGALGCISCHDPHVKPAPQAAAAYFRDRCARCHNADGVQCAAPLAQRQTENGDSCIACHMPRNPTSNVVHTSLTDHRILRRPAAGSSAPKGRFTPDQLPIAPFQPDRIGDDLEHQRDLGIALVHMSDTLKSPAPALQAHRRLYEALQRHPDDAEAREMFGLGLLWQQDFAAAKKALAELLAAEPDRETAVYNAAQCARFLREPAEEQKHLEHLVKLNQNNAGYWTRLAELRADQEDWPGARTAAERAVAVSAFNSAARRVLVQTLAHTGEVESARKHAAIYEALGGDVPALERLLKR
jgi:predicted CXXCH cytochrome family protein